MSRSLCTTTESHEGCSLTRGLVSVGTYAGGFLIAFYLIRQLNGWLNRKPDTGNTVAPTSKHSAKASATGEKSQPEKSPSQKSLSPRATAAPKPSLGGLLLKGAFIRLLPIAPPIRQAMAVYEIVQFARQRFKQV